MKLSLQLSDFSVPGGAGTLGGTLVDIARAADEGGFAGITAGDHVWQHPMMGGVERELLECYSTLSFLAAHTHRVDLLALVSMPTMRPPGLLAKTVTTLDVLSGGRAWLGIGAGHYAEETAGLGIPFPPLRERYEILEETLQFCLRMWSAETGDEGEFHGRHIHADRLLNSPQCLRRPHPPIVIAGTGVRRTLPLVVRYADACSLRPGPDLPATLDALRAECAHQGRDYDSIEKSCAFEFDVGMDGSGTAELVERLRPFADLGIEHMYGRVRHQHLIRPVEAIGGDVIPVIASW